MNYLEEELQVYWRKLDTNLCVKGFKKYLEEFYVYFTVV